jgi:hypothetical protein
VSFDPQESATELRRRLKNVGLSDPAIRAAWPTWWSDAADASPSARAELRFSIARKLGLDPHSLLQADEEPRFVWRGAARFKHLTDQGEVERLSLISFGAALASAILNATPEWIPVAGRSALDIRNAILVSQRQVRFVDLLSACWSFGIPVVHLRVFPWPQKRMAAMTVQLGSRNAILLAKDSEYPPHIAFYLAHELGHAALKHVKEGSALVDLELPIRDLASDPEELAADKFALELLTGEPSPKIVPFNYRGGSRSLAAAAINASEGLMIEPGTLALCFGYSSGNWAVANGAMRRIYSTPKAVWREVNGIALRQLDLDRIPEDLRLYVRAVLGNLAR